MDNVYIQRYGHNCLKLAAFLPDLNTRELIWETMKGYTARRNVTLKMADVVKLTHDAIAAVSEDYWISAAFTTMPSVELKFMKIRPTILTLPLWSSSASLMIPSRKILEFGRVGTPVEPNQYF